MSEKLDFTINIESLANLDNVKVDIVTFQKMVFLFNSIEQGWTVKKREGAFVFTKPHENKKEVIADSYIMQFMKTGLDVSKCIA